MLTFRTLASATALAVMLTGGAMQARADSDSLFSPLGKVAAAPEVGPTRTPLTEVNEPSKHNVFADAADAAANAAAAAANAAAATAANAAAAATANAAAAAAAATATAAAAANAAAAPPNVPTGARPCCR